MTAHPRLLSALILTSALAFAAPLLSGRTSDQDRAAELKPVVLFTPHSLPGGISVPLPSLLVTRKGTAIAVCEFRRKGLTDFGHESDIIIRRSMDSGRSWGPVQEVYGDAGVNAVNGPIVQDTSTGAIVLTFTEVPASIATQTGWVEHMAQSGGSVWAISSTDEGQTWSKPVEAKPIGRDGWVAWAGNNSHGVQLPNGRLIIEGMAHKNRPGETFHSLDYSSCILYSDDHGQSWHIGATTTFYGTDESTLALCSDGSILVSSRINNRTPDDLVRWMTRSRDGGLTYAETWMQDNMSLVRCHAGMLQWVDHSRGAPRYILAHSGPQGGFTPDDPLSDRTRLTIRLSYDDGRTWPTSRLLLPAKVNTEYSDLALAPDGSILCLYTARQHSLQGTVSLLSFSLASVESVYSPLVN